MKRLFDMKIAALLLLSIPTGNAQADVGFTDNTFNNAGWNAVKIYDTTAGQTATFTATQIASGGNAGAYRQTTHTYGVGGIGVAHLGSFIYNPAAQGGIGSIAFSYDINASQVGVSGAIAYSLVALQDNAYYMTGYDLTFSPAWHTFNHSGLGALDFTLVGGAGHPDFSAAGGGIQFGYLTLNGTAYGVGNTVSGIDNFSITVTNAAPAPEPETYAMLLAGLGLMGFMATRRKGGTA